MKRSNVILGSIVCAICIILIVTLTNFQKEEPLILTTNPKSIVAGQKFNEIDGVSSLGAIGRNFNKYDIIYINDIEQPSTVAEDGRIVTCIVQDEIYTTPGKLHIQVKRVKDGQVIRKSNIVTIKVKHSEN